MTDRPSDHLRAEAAFAEFQRTGSPRAMAEVFDRTAAELLVFARRFARDAASAEDLVQQTFLRAIERAATFAPDRQLMPWLTTILANEARMETRRRRTPDPDRIPHTAPQAEPSREAERREAAAAMDTALAQLPPSYRDVVALRLLHGVRPKGIAQALALPLPTVKTRLHRGVRKLAASLPRGLALGTAVALCAGHGLRAGRRAVRAHAAGSAAATAWTLTGLLAMKKTALPIALAAVLLTALWILFGSEEPRDPIAEQASAAHTAAPGAARAEAPAPGPDSAAGASTGAARTEVEAASADNATLANAIHVQAHWRSSGQPAAGVPFTLLVQPYEWLATATTDASGTAVFALDRIDDLARRAPQGVSVECALRRGSFHNVALDGGGGSPKIVEVEVDDGRQLAGLVVDAAGLPVAGAAVWLVADQYSPAFVLARSEAGGRFALRGLRDSFVIRATEGSSASPRVSAADLDGEGEVVLRLSVATNRLAIRVTDTDGRPVAAAAAHLDNRRRGREEKHWFVATDAEGFALVEGIDAGRYHLEVVHPSYPPALRTIEFPTDGEDREEAVALGSSAELEGRVRRADGEPVVFANVEIGEDAASMLQRMTSTDREGRFRFTGLAVGRHRLWITRAGSDIRRSIELHAGRHKLDIVAPGRGRIAGRLVDADDRALVGWSVVAKPISDFNGSWSTTGGDGRFAIGGLTDSYYRLEVRSGDSGVVASFLDVATDGRELVYQVPPGALPSAFLVGRIEGAPDCSLVLARREPGNEGSGLHVPVPADGRFEIGPLPPATHDVGLELASWNRTWWLATVDLAAGERHDLGTIRVPALGGLEVEVRDELGCQDLAAGVRPAALGPTLGQSLERIDRETWRAIDLPPGEYDVYVRADATAVVQQRVTIEPGCTAKVELATTEGAVAAYRLAPPAGTEWEAVGLQTITIRRADGRVVDFSRIMGSLDHEVRLLRGVYMIEVATGGGFCGRATIEVPQAEGEEAVVPIAR